MEKQDIIEKQRYGELMELGMCPDGHIRIIDRLNNSREKVNNELVKTYYETTHEFTQDTQSMLQVIWDKCKMYEEQRKVEIDKQFHEFFAENAPHPISMEALYLICNYFYFFPKRISKERPTLSVPYRLYQIMNSNLPTIKLQLEQPFEGGYVYSVGGWNSFKEYEKNRNNKTITTTMETKNNNAGGNWEYIDLSSKNGVRTFLDDDMIRVHNKKSNHTVTINRELSNFLREKETLCLRVRIDRDLGTIQFVFNKTTGRRPRLDRAQSQSLSYASTELVSLIMMGNKKTEVEDFKIRRVGITDDVVIYELIK